jgi:pectate lyase
VVDLTPAWPSQRTNASDLLTVSYNRLHDRDKTMLIGSSDSRITDRGKLRVTVHHNQFP